MNSIILCEGPTDFVLLQYFMRKAYGWEDLKNQVHTLQGKVAKSRVLTRGEDKLTIAGCGGASKVLPLMDYVLERNSLSANDEAYDKIVLITDRDEIETEDNFLDRMSEIVMERGLQGDTAPGNDTWSQHTYINGQGREKTVMILLLVIPFEATGAMETFLLNAISDHDDYDADMIKKGNLFVEEVDPEKRYLTKRRYVTKAKFDVYFSVRTAAEQFAERQNVIKNVEWEKYVLIQKSFRKLGELCSE